MTERKTTELDKIHQDLIEVLKKVKARCSNEPEFPLLIQNVSKSIEAVHSIILNKIKGEGNEK